MRRRWSEQRIGVFFHLGRVLINREIGKQRLVTVRFAPKADITQRIEHVRKVPEADMLIVGVKIR